MKKFVHTLNSYFIIGVLAAFYVLAIGASFLMLKLRDLTFGKRQTGWEKSRMVDESFSSPY